jgi:hypothetical protein
MSTSAATRPAAKRRDPLQPLTAVVQVAFCLAFALFLVGVARILVFSGGSFGWNGGSACVDLSQQLQRPEVGLVRATRSVTNTMITDSRICVTPASTRQAFYSTLANGMGFPFFLLAFGLTSHLLTVATRHGIHSDTVVRKLRFLGWTLLIGEAVVVVLRVVGSVHLYNQLVDGHAQGTYWTPFWHVNWTVLLIGLCLLTFARIVREGVTMREDLDGTV